jgi:hypothetical protein
VGLRAGTITWTGAAGNQLYNSPGNWSCGGCGAYPNNSGPNTYDAVIDPANPDTTNVNVSALINSLTTGTNAAVNVLAGKTLTLGSAASGIAGVLSNAGTLNIGASGASLVISSAVSSSITNSGTIGLNASGSASSLVLDSGSNAATFTLTGGGALVLSDDSHNAIRGLTGAEALVNDSGHTIQGAGTISGFSSFTNNGVLTANSTSGNALIVSGLSNANGSGTLTNGTYSASATLQLSGVGALTTLNSSGAGNVAAVNISGGGLVTGNGTANALSGLANITDASLTLTNATGFGALTPQGGTLTISTSANQALNPASLTLAGTALTVNGSLATLVNSGGASAGVALSSGSTLAVTGGFAQTGGLSTADSSTLHVTGALTQDSASSLTLTNGTQATAASLSNAGTVAIDVTSSLTVGTLTNLSGGTLSGGTYNLAGTLQYSGAGVSSIASGTSLELIGSGSLLYSNGSGTHNALSGLQSNAGTLTVEQGAVLSPTGGLSNTGTVSVDTGGAMNVAGTFSNASSGSSLQIGNTSAAAFTSQGFTNNGMLTIGTGSTANVQGGTFTNLSGSLLIGGTYNINGTFQYSGADITLIATNATVSLGGSIQAGDGSDGLGKLRQVNGSLTITNGLSETITPGSGALVVSPTGTLQVSDYSSLFVNGSLNNQGALNVTGQNASLQASGFSNSGTFTLGGTATANFTGGTFANLTAGSLQSGTYDIAGTMTFDGGPISDIASGASLTLRGPNASLMSGGNDALAGSLSSNEGTLTFIERAALTNSGDFSNSGVVNVSGPGDTFTVSGQFTNTGTVAIGNGGEIALSGSYLQDAGTTTVDGLLAASEADVNGGTLLGSGEIGGLLVNDGTVNAGDMGSPGTLNIDNGYTQESGGTLDIGIADHVSAFGSLSVSGDVTLSGALDVQLDGGFVPTLGEMFQIITFTGNLYGDFTSTNFGVFGNNYTFEEIRDSNDITLEVIQGASPAVPEPSTLLLTGGALAALAALRMRRRTV